jgi:hypothetical protein
MKRSRWLQLAVAAPLVLAGCKAMTAHTDVVARAAGRELKVEDAARILASNPQIPADPQVVRALADLWVDYTLLATAVAEDNTLSTIKLDKFLEPESEQLLVWKLREQVIHPDTVFSEQQITERWATEGPGVEIHARHILLRVPSDATPAQRDSVQQLAESLRQRAASGEDFSKLAEEYSQDPGSAARGGDLGWFGRGRMVAPFEEAAFRLEPGQVSNVVESPFGYHIIKVEERRQPELGAGEREQFRQMLVQRSEQEAETAYLDSLSNAAKIDVASDGVTLVRDIANQPDRTLKGRAATRVVARYEGGELTAGEVAQQIRMLPPNVQAQFAGATDQQLDGAVKTMVRRELLLREAATHKIELTAAEQDSIRTQAREALRQVVELSGFGQVPQGAQAQAAIDAQVRQLIEGAVSGTHPVVPLGQLAYALRDAYPNEINAGAFPAVVKEIEKLRGGQPQPQPQPQQGVPAPQGGVPEPAAPAPQGAEQ